MKKAEAFDQFLDFHVKGKCSSCRVICTST